MILHTLRVEIVDAGGGTYLNGRGLDHLADAVADAVDGDLGADILEALKLPQDIKDLVAVRVEWA